MQQDADGSQTVQKIMEDIFQDMKDVKVYIDNIIILGNSKEHMFTIQDDIFSCLEENRFTINAFKSFQM
jgi:hypothetical protein